MRVVFERPREILVGADGGHRAMPELPLRVGDNVGKHLVCFEYLCRERGLPDR